MPFLHVNKPAIGYYYCSAKGLKVATLLIKLFTPDEELFPASKGIVKAEGNIQAFSLMYDTHAPQLLGYIMQTIKIKETAEQILADAFLKLWDIMKDAVKNDEERLLKILIFTARYYINLSTNTPV